VVAAKKGLKAAALEKREERIKLAKQIQEREEL
jgi:hypothetical protein